MRHFFFMVLVAMTGQTFASSQIVYGKDNRVEVKDVKGISKIASAVAGRVKNSKIRFLNVNGTTRSSVEFGYAPLLGSMFGANVCKDERFTDQVTLSDCTGFLVGNDKLVTAGHCVTSPGNTIENTVNNNCARYSWVFDYKVDDSGKFNTSDFSLLNIYGCKKIIYATVNLENDFAIIQLSRKVKGRTPLKIRKNGEIKDDQEIFVVGHPTGLPMKYADGAEVLDNSHPNYFVTNLDTFGGNSGSPVFNATTKKVEGILVRGRADYVPSSNPNERCMRVNNCSQDGRSCELNSTKLNGEHVTRITEILNYL